MPCNTHHLLKLLAIAATLTTSYSQSTNAATANCPPLGPVLPAPRALSNDPSILNITSKVTRGLQQLTSFNGSAVSIGVQSIHEDVPFLNYHYTPPVLSPRGAQKVTEDTIYRIGSVSKVFTVLAILQLGIPLSDPITKYVPELLDLSPHGNAIDSFAWQNITIDAMTSQLAGLTGQYFFAKFSQRHPVYAPYTTPSYSDEAYSILGFVIEAVSNTTYADYLQDHIFEPYGLTHTSVLKPAEDTTGFISTQPPWWAESLGFENPTGGLYSSTRDMLRLGTLLLNHTLLPPTTTRAWLKPHTHTSSLGLSVGAPWEIARSDTLTSDGRVVDFYTKTGGLGVYNALFVLVPDYDIVLTAFLAGPEVEYGLGTMLGVVSQVLEAVVPAVEGVGRRQAEGRYDGVYGRGNDSMTITVDDGPGLRIAKWMSTGKDVLAEYPKIVATSPAGSLGAPLVSARLYPTGLRTGTEEAWRAVFDTTTAKEAGMNDKRLFLERGSCQTWSGIDEILYGLVGLDDFVFAVEEGGGHASAVMPRAFRQTLEYVK